MKVIKEKKKRNASLIKDYLSGMSVMDLVFKYKISPQRINQIRKKYNIPANKKKD